ncbi:MAG: Rrf2 family transcriptional regulator [Oxalobacteraceae bacterium]|nr:Rrf2 family transcriptional regulator [Oxalobacteraceae bacterium]
MRLTHFTDIGLRVLIYLSRVREAQASVTVAEIASQFDISVNHLVKVVGRLARAGWIQTTRGRNGGMRLCIDASALKVGTVLRELEGDAELADCDGQVCRLNQNCRLRGALQVGLHAFYDAMNAYTLLDISEGATGEQIVRMHRIYLGQSPHIRTGGSIN